MPQPLTAALAYTQAILKAINNPRTSLEAKGIRMQILAARRNSLVDLMVFSQPGDKARSELIKFIDQTVRQKSL